MASRMKKKFNIEILELKDRIFAAKEVETISIERAKSKIVWIIDIFGGEAVPIVGDLVSSWYFYFQSKKLAKKAQLPKKLQNKILKYYIMDTLCGLIPGLGLIGDIFYRANKKTAKIFENYREKLENRLVEIRKTNNEQT